ncbi:MAG TPA: serine hydrolase domain-containing protein [Rhizomicrobium sp.]|jgi:CubicO group peptidase (beta-lactamase class C family)|nr:serine hydrolase domain-containing protein [Rhizomicrobium sp.]
MIRKFLTAGLVLTAIAASAAAFAAPPSTGPVPFTPNAGSVATEIAPPAAKPGVHDLTAQDLHAFLDGLIPYAIRRGDIAGATFSVVKDGKLLFADGYGYADLKSRKPVIADTTLFRLGSTSKLFTWTAVMQLVEEGKLNLDADVNTYLDFKVPEKFGKPITLRNIMTHTAGYEEVVTDTLIAKPEQLYPLRKYLLDHMPNRIFPPGKVVAYSNYATTMAGYIVQRVSGEPFEAYIENHIFKPLGMAHSTFRQPPPPALAASVATGYRTASDGTPIPFEVVEPAPAGSLSSTATDMAHFMLAHLNGGAIDGARILKPETVAMMHSRNYTLAPHLLNGFDLGFYQENRNGHQVIGHAGDLEAFHTDLHLITDAGVGIFMSFNCPGKDGAVQPIRTAIFRAFLDRYFPYTPPAEKTVANPMTDAARVAGSYEASRRKDSVLRLFFQLTQATVTALPDGTIMVDEFKDEAGAPKKWREVGPLYYQELNGQAHLEFVPNADGTIDHFASDDFLPVELFQRVNGLDALPMLKTLGSLTLIVCLLTVAIWFGGWIARRRFGRPLALEPMAARLRTGSRLGAVLVLLVTFGWGGLITAVTANEFLLFGGALDPWIVLLYVIGVLAIFGCLVMIANGVRRALGGPGGWLVRVGDLVLALAGLYGLWAIYDYGLANFTLNL